MRYRVLEHFHVGDYRQYKVVRYVVLYVATYYCKPKLCDAYNNDMRGGGNGFDVERTSIRKIVSFC